MIYGMARSTFTIMNSRIPALPFRLLLAIKNAVFNLFFNPFPWNSFGIFVSYILFNNDTNQLRTVSAYFRSFRSFATFVSYRILFCSITTQTNCVRLAHTFGRNWVFCYLRIVSYTILFNNDTNQLRTVSAYFRAKLSLRIYCGSTENLLIFVNPL